VQERVCRTVTDYQQVCRDVPTQRQVCQYETRYRNETYACSRWERRPVQELLSRTNASVKFDIRKDPQLNLVQSEIITSLNNGSLQVRAENAPGSQNALLLASKEIRRSQNGNEVQLDAVYRVSVYDRTRFTAPFQYDAQLGGVARQGQLEVTLPTNVAYPHLLGFVVRVLDASTGQLVAQGKLTAQQARLENNGGLARGLIDLNNLGQAPVPAGQSYQIELTVEANLGDREPLELGSRPGFGRQSRGFVMVE
jgi:hypothetical protein